MRFILAGLILISAFLNASAEKNKDEIYKQVQKLLSALVEQARSKDAVAPEKKITIAVVDFQDNGEELKKIEFGKGFSEIVSGRLGNVEGVVAINRKRTDALMNEMELSLSGLVDEKNALQVGRMLAADYLLTGSASQMGDNINLTLNLTASETGAVSSSITFHLAAKSVLPMASAASHESKYPSTAAFRSMAVPGWGMYYNDKPGLGGFYFGTTYSFIAAAVVFSISAKIADSDYKSINEVNWGDYYPEALSVTDAVILASETRYRREVLRNISWGAAGGMWLISIIHSGMAASKINRNIKTYTSADEHLPICRVFVLPAADGASVILTAAF